MCSDVVQMTDKTLKIRKVTTFSGRRRKRPSLRKDKSLMTDPQEKEMIVKAGDDEAGPAVRLSEEDMKV